MKKRLVFVVFACVAFLFGGCERYEPEAKGYGLRATIQPMQSGWMFAGHIRQESGSIGYGLVYVQDPDEFSSKSDEDR